MAIAQSVPYSIATTSTILRYSNGAAWTGGGGGDRDGIDSGGLGVGSNVFSAGNNGTGATNNPVGNNDWLFFLVVFEKSLITVEEARSSDVFNRIVVKLDMETNGKEILSIGKAANAIMRQKGL